MGKILKSWWARGVAIGFTALVIASLLVVSLPNRVTIETSNGIVSISVSYATALAQSPETRSPTANSGSAWANPTNAYADGTNNATIISNSPSGNNTWGNYGFSLTGDTITKVRVRYDAASVNGSSQTQTRVPTGDTTQNGTWVAFPTSPASLWDKVDETTADDSNGIVGQTNGGGSANFTFTAFSVPIGSTITNLQVVFRATDNASGGSNDIRSFLSTAGSSGYFGAPQDCPSSLTTYTQTWTTNPKTGATWTVGDINGTSTNGLKGFGVCSTDFAPDVNVTMVYAQVNYTSANDETISIAVSWNNGTNWSASQTTNLTSSEATYWYDVTTVNGSWTPAQLANGQLITRALATTVGDTGNVSLDWIPVEVTYTTPTPVISVNPNSYAFGVVTLGSTNNTTATYFTITNNSTISTNATIQILSNAWTSSGTGWTHSDNASGANTAAIKAVSNNSTTWNGNTVFVKFNSPYNVIIQGVAPQAISTWKFGLSLLAPTSVLDGASNNNTIRITAYQS